MQLWLILAINDFKFWHLTNFETHPSLVELPAAPSNSRHSCHRHFFYNLCPSFFTLWTFFRSPSSPLASFSKWGKAEQRRKRRLSKPDFLCIHFNSRASCSSFGSSMSTPQKSIFRALYKLPWPPRQVGPFLEHQKTMFLCVLQGQGQGTILHSACMCRFCLFARFQSRFEQLSTIKYWFLKTIIINQTFSAKQNTSLL